MVPASNLSVSRLRELLHYDPESGVFTWRAGRKGVARSQIEAGDINPRGYRRISVDRRRYMANVLAWLYMTGDWPQGDVDHRNGVRHDNRWSNLRDVPRSTNNENQKRAHCRNKAGLLGVSPNRSRWSASIMVKGRKLHLGTFDTPELAHAAYLEAKRVHHAGNTL